MGILCLKVPSAEAQVLSTVTVPGERIPAQDKHITLLYLGKQTPDKDALECVRVCFGLSKIQRSFHVMVQEAMCFPLGDDGVPIVGKVESDEIFKFQLKLQYLLTRAGIEFSRKYPIYRPHVTLSYASSPIPSTRIRTASWIVDRFCFWSGDDEEKKGLSAEFSLE